MRKLFDRRFVGAVMRKENIENVHSSRLLIILDCFWTRDNKKPSPVFEPSISPAVLSSGSYSVENRPLGVGLGLQNLE